MRRCHSSIKLMTYDAFPLIARTERTAQEGHCSTFRAGIGLRLFLLWIRSFGRLRAPRLPDPSGALFFAGTDCT